MFTDPQKLLADLVDDAKRVAAYGQRTGRLKDYELLQAIAAVDKLGPLTWSAPEVVSLQAGLNRALQAIYPTSLSDLRSDWDPFGTNRSRGGQLAFVLATLVVMAITALATFEYNRGISLLKAANTMQAADPRAAMGVLARQLLDVKLDGTGGKAAVVLDEPHYVLVDKLHEIDAQLARYVPELIKFREEHPLPHELFSPKKKPSKEVEDRITATGYGQFNGCSAAGPIVTAAAAPGAAPMPATLVAQAGGETTGTPSAAGAPSKATAPVETGNATVVAALSRHLTDIEAVSCIAKLAYSPLDIPPIAGIIGYIVDWSNIWGLWFLPALYGALGAMLYYMRRILDPTIPDPSVIRIVHRTALGAFAGVIITWFWAPNSELSEGFTSVGITVFTLAFLIGFSIEVLFSLLDRLVGTMIDMAKGNDKTPPPPALPVKP